ncbi:MAG: PucR family transcriptional regulator, partial [Phycicoccus sp.]
MSTAGARPSGATRRRVARAAGDLGAAAVRQMEADHEWFRSLSAENRSWVGLVAQAGITAFVDWFGGGHDVPSGSADVFG